MRALCCEGALGSPGSLMQRMEEGKFCFFCWAWCLSQNHLSVCGVMCGCFNTQLRSVQGLMCWYLTVHGVPHIELLGCPLDAAPFIYVCISKPGRRGFSGNPGSSARIDVPEHYNPFL